MTTEAFVDSVNQDQTAQNLICDLDTVHIFILDYN